MQIQLSEHFNYSKLLRFTAPSIAMMVFLSIYSITDGIFVSNFVGSTALAAVNIIFPFFTIFGAFGFMLGSGGNALVAKTLGENKKFKANQIFSLLIYTTIIFGVIVSVFGLLFLKPLVLAFKIKAELLEDSIIYGRILFPAVVAFMLQYIFQAFFIAAERPNFGFFVTVIAGCLNIGLDALFMIVFKWGLAGAAWATSISMYASAIIPLIYFISPNKSPLRLGKTKLYISAIFKSCSNGFSEFMSNISMSVVATLYNYQMLKFVGENGVAAYSIIAYINFIFLSVFLGYSIGSNPIVSFHYGAENKTELCNLRHRSLILIGIFAVIMTTLAEILTVPLAKIFVSYDKDLLQMTVKGFHIYAISFLFAGFNIYASAFFTALNNGLVSAVISFCRTLVFECLCVLILPIFFGINGIWFAIIVAEILALAVSFGFIYKLQQRYGY